ncbi:MAG: DUF3866 family protein [Acidimicrobiia bacterium]
MKFQMSRVTEILAERDGLQKVATGVGRAYVLTGLTGTVATGDEVVLNTTAVELGLGTGGWHFVHWNLSTRELDLPGGGHIMKLRYTSLQSDTGSTEERDDYVEPTGLEGLPVAACGLHSQVGVVAAVFATLAPGRRLVYVMTDGAALPIALSDLVHDLRERGLLHATVTAGHAFGGDHEAVSLPSALLVARWAGADAIVCGMGPGVVGTGTRLGTTAVEVANIVDATVALGGRSVLVARASDADGRERHQGVSHHTRTALDLATQEPLVADPAEWSLDTDKILEGAGLQITSMGRGPSEDPAFFAWAGAGGAALAALAR